MSLPSPESPHHPQPGLPRTIGYLNLLFGTILLACGGTCLKLSSGFLIEFSPLQLEPRATRDVLEHMRSDTLNDLGARERQAKSPTDRQRLATARADLQSASADLTGKVDFARINHDLPWLGRYLWADAVSGPVLDVAMLVAGVGLIRLKGWGRHMAIGVAALKIVRLLVLTGLLVFVVVPRMTDVLGQFARTDFGSTFFAGQMELQNAQRAAVGAGPGPTLTSADLVQVFRAIGHVSALMMLALGVIYPVVTLVVLARPGARLACQTPRPDAAEPAPGPEE
jgi:hypothetical protein